ncbi:MAG TPA: carboxypeptidase-like regulatory domain-containing protein [Pyrinomonadaceae bacterium]
MAPVLLLLIGLPVIGQTEAAKADSITGRVVNESGQPLPHARIAVSPFDGGRAGGQTSTDRDGNFKVTGLDPVPYRIHVDVPGYLRIGEPEPGQPVKQYKVGESATFVFTKGGVITGAVTNATGEPVIGIAVRARRIRDQKDQPITSTTYYREVSTDDRGVYRIYSLPAGTYTVAAGGASDYYYGAFGPFDTFVPTYAPSSATRDGAVEVSVRAGEEASNVDISFRAEMGRTISGTVTGPGTEGGFTVNLTMAGPAASQSNFSRYSQAGIPQFSFQGLADGDYYLIAQSHLQSGEVTLSEPRLIRLKGADIDDVDVTLKTLGSVSGRVLLEESKVTECQGKQPPAFKELWISAWHKDSEEARSQPPFVWSIGRPVNPDTQGAFTIQNLASSQYYFAARFPARSWYLKSIAIAPPAGARKPSDVTRVWTNIKTGDRLAGLIVTLAQGGASLQGQLALGEGETIPEKLFVYLVPTEREAASDPLRFYGGEVSKEGKISLFNLAPGRYWILAQQTSDSTSVPLTKMKLPDGTETRAQLRRDAEATKLEIELKPCQSVVDFRFSHR